MATETLIPSSIDSSADIDSGALTDIDEGCTSPDGNFLRIGGSGHLLLGFPTPTGSLTVGAGLQTFRIYGSRSGATGTGTAHLYENGSLVSSNVVTISPLNTVLTLWTGTWNANLLSDATGVNVQLRLEFSAGASPAWVIDAAEWIADYTAGQPYAKRLGGVPGMRLNRGVW